MRTEDFDYTLPPDLIATRPVEPRDASRLLVMNRSTGEIDHRVFADLPNLLHPRDCLVLNDSKVIAARLIGRRPGGGQAEVLLIEPEGEGRWRALVRPGRKLGPGARISIGGEGVGGAATIEIMESVGGGERLIRFESELDIDALLEAHGRAPLPPYILSARKRRGEDSGDDRDRYQTVYATSEGSVAAPTAGLHFTKGLLKKIEARGVEVRRVTLHVGPGTFAPVKVDDPADHVMHGERFTIAESEARAIEEARSDPGRRVVAVGTTVTRVLESCLRTEGGVGAASRTTDLKILPGFEFRVVDALLTNFHLPRSTLLMLVSAFAGRDRVLDAYREAIDRAYRFYSFGDAMLIG